MELKRKFLIHFYVKKLTMRLLCLKLINHALVWIFTEKMRMMLPNPITFATVKLSL